MGLVEELDPDGVPVSLLVVDWLPGDHDPTHAAHTTQDHLDQQIPHHPATAGWTVTATPEPTPRACPTTPPHWPATVLAAAAHCTALPVDLLAQAYSDEFPDPDLPLAAIRGSLIVAANWVADELLDDADALAHGGTIEDTSQLVNLPPQFEPHYTPGFARQFLVAFLDLSARLTADQWTPPSCVAQELGVRLLLDQATGVADLAGITLPPDWPGHPGRTTARGHRPRIPLRPRPRRIRGRPHLRPTRHGLHARPGLVHPLPRPPTPAPLPDLTRPDEGHLSSRSLRSPGASTAVVLTHADGQPRRPPPRRAIAQEPALPARRLPPESAPLANGRTLSRVARSWVTSPGNRHSAT